MELVIASTALAAMIAHAAAAMPNEACGVLVARVVAVDAAVPAANVAATPRTCFEIDPATLLATHRAARTAGLRIAGWYHSHPNGRAEPSATDAARAVPDGRVWMIVAGGTVAAWRAVTGGAVHDRFDPLILVAA